jgi:hypothetical protein
MRQDRPAPDAVKQLRDAYSLADDVDYDDYEHNLYFSAFKLAGVPDTTFVWRCVPRLPFPPQLIPQTAGPHDAQDLIRQQTKPQLRSTRHSEYSFGCDDICRLHMLYLLEGQDRRFRLLLDTAHGERVAEGSELHLPRFFTLRPHLRTAIPALARVSDPTLVALLCAMGDSNAAGTVKHVASHFAFTRIMKGHPRCGDGEPTEAERALAGLCRDSVDVPADLGKRPGGDDALEPESYVPMEWLNIRGLCVLNAMEDPSFKPRVEKAVALLDAFHRGA